MKNLVMKAFISQFFENNNIRIEITSTSKPKKESRINDKADEAYTIASEWVEALFPLGCTQQLS